MITLLLVILCNFFSFNSCNNTPDPFSNIQRVLYYRTFQYPRCHPHVNQTSTFSDYQFCSIFLPFLRKTFIDLKKFGAPICHIPILGLEIWIIHSPFPSTIYIFPYKTRLVLLTFFLITPITDVQIWSNLPQTTTFPQEKLLFTLQNTHLPDLQGGET